MAGETPLAVCGNLTNAPELRYTSGGKPVASFTIASTPRSFDKTTSEWKDGEALFIRCSLWGPAAEHAAESLEKGCRVVATGRLTSRTYETKSGEQRTAMELVVDDIGASVKHTTVAVKKTSRSWSADFHPSQNEAVSDAPF